MLRYQLRTLLIVLAIGPPVLAYVGSYYFVSRRGYAHADSIGLSKSFFFVPPEADRDGRLDGRYQRFYWPLIQLELMLGTGRYPFAGTRGLS